MGAARLSPVVVLVGLLALEALGAQGQPQPEPAQAGQAQRPGRPIDRPPRDPQATTPQPVGTAVITGIVVAADGNTPLRRARVSVSATELREGRAVMTGDDGRYEVKELPAGRYTVQVSKPGYVSLTFGQRRPRQPGLPLQLGESERLNGVNFSLPRGGVISGHVFDETGNPLIRATVRAQRYDYQQGERRLVPVGFDQTDDRGQYRIFDLLPGDYYINASTDGPAFQNAARQFGRGGGPGGGGRFQFDRVEDEAETGYAPTFYPGSPAPTESGRITLGLSQELTSIDFAVQLVRTARVSGTLTTSNGKRLTNGMVALDSEIARGQRMAYSGRAQGDGSFSIGRVPPGSYRLIARGRAEGTEEPLTAVMPISIGDGDLTGLSVSLNPGATITGQIVFEGGRTPSAGTSASQVRVLARALEADSIGGNPTANVRADRSFELRGLSPGAAVIQIARPPSGWALKSVMIGARDVTDVPVELKSGDHLTDAVITLTEAVTELSGTVINERREPQIDYTVVIFPADPAEWSHVSRRIDGRRVDQSGQFRFTGLPAGRYLLALVDAVEQGQWTDPEFLDQIKSGAATLTLNDGERKVQDVTVPSER
jgi:hypothetical protein